MRMSKEPLLQIRLSHNQMRILNLLIISPRELIANNVCRCLNRDTRDGYFSTWRALQSLEANNLVTRNGRFYSITEEGRVQYDKRKR